MERPKEKERERKKERETERETGCRKKKQRSRQKGVQNEEYEKNDIFVTQGVSSKNIFTAVKGEYY